MTNHKCHTYIIREKCFPKPAKCPEHTLRLDDIIYLRTAYFVLIEGERIKKVS